MFTWCSGDPPLLNLIFSNLDLHGASGFQKQLHLNVYSMWSLLLSLAFSCFLLLSLAFSCFLLLSPDTHTHSTHTRWCPLILCLSLDQNAHADLGDEHQREKGLRQTLEAQVSELTSRVAELQAQQRRDSDANRRLQTHTSSLEEQV